MGLPYSLYHMISWTKNEDKITFMCERYLNQCVSVANPYFNLIIHVIRLH